MLGRTNSIRRNLLALLLASPWLALSFVRIFSLDHFWPLIPLVAFTPQMLLLMLIPMIAAIAMRARTISVVLLLTAGVLVALLLPRAIANDQPTAGGRTLTILSANLLAGRAEIAPLAAAIERADPDVIALQEATPEDLLELRTAGAFAGRPYEVGEPQSGTLGYSTISKFRLSVIPGTELHGDRWPELRIGNTGVRFRNIHTASPLEPENSKLWNKTLGEIPSSGDQLRLVVGDFNATLDHRAFRSVLDRGYRDAGDQTGNGFKWTWVVTRTGRLVIDHVLVPPGVDVQSFEVVDLPGSDHNAIVARVRLPN